MRTGLFRSLIKQIITGEKGQAQEQVCPAGNRQTDRKTATPPTDRGKSHTEALVPIVSYSNNKCSLPSQIAKDIERWANRLNKQEESFKSSFQGLGQDRDEDRREAAAANTGFSTFFEKK